jgi:hypothetical protein
MTQSNYIVLKKGGKGIKHFWTGSYIIFQLKDGQWLNGVITKITPDSFYFKNEIIRYYLMGTDTLHFSGYSFSLKDIRALPTRKQMIVYKNDQVRVVPGHEKFLWIRNGFIFQVTGAGYIGLNVTNHLINNDPLFGKKNLLNLGIGAAVFLFGEVLHLRFYPYLRIGKKYHLESMILQNSGGNVPR